MFRPSPVGDHEVGVESLGAQAQARSRHFLATAHAGFGAAEIAVGLWSGIGGRLVGQGADITEARREALTPALTEEDNVVSGPPGQARREMAELSRRVLMDEEDPHGDFAQVAEGYPTTNRLPAG